MKMDKKRFAAIMGTLYVCFDREPNMLQVDTYFNILSESLSIEQIESGAKQWMTVGRFFPKPVELLEQIPEINPDYRASAAWQVALRFGITNRRPLNFQDPIINMVIRRLGGLDYFARLGEDEANRFVRQRFIDEYKRAWCNRVNLLASDLKPLTCSITNRDDAMLIGCDYQQESILKIENAREPESFVLKLARNLHVERIGNG
jgi:hypothetical protein